jgi:hypothetical protein
LAGSEPSGLPVVVAGTSSAGQLAAQGPVFAESLESLSPSEGSGYRPVAESIRKLPSDSPNVSAWIAESARGGICVLVSRRQAVKGSYPLGSSCTATVSPSEGSYSELSAEGSSGVAVAGVAPEGVSSVQVTLSDGKTETIPVVDDAWTLEEPVQSVHYVVGG